MSVAAFKSARHPTAPPRDNSEGHRHHRHVKRNLKLQRQIRDLVTANPHCKYVGGNAAVENIAARLGFEPHDLAIADVKIGRRIVTMICVPHRVWDTPYTAAKSIDLRVEARMAGYNAILVPQAVVEREPRLGNSQRLARTAKFKVDATSRMAILHHLIEHGPSCLSELADVVVHVDPIGAVLHMATTGAVDIDLNQCITPYTLVDIATPAGTRH